MNRTTRYTAVFAAFSAVLLFASCEFGLGSQVDTDTPTVSITNPAISSVRGNAITITGSCNDDAGVSRVEVSLRDKEGNTRSLGTASLTDDKTSWSLGTDLSAYTDGEYSIVANAIDGADRKATATREFYIDNTPPVVLLSKPNSFVSSDIGSGGFGKTVTVAGEILDDSDIASITVTVYRYNRDTKKETKVNLPHPTFTDFDVQGGLSLVIAQEGSDDPALQANYDAMYEEDGESTQYFTMVFAATDVAGNTNTYTYIKSALNKVVSGATGVAVKNLTSGDYKDILKGTYSGALDAETVTKILKGEYTATTDYITGAGGKHIIFTTCPDSSPKYELTGYALSDIKEAEKGATLGIAFEKGLDSKLIDPATVDVSIYACDSEGTISADEPAFTTKGAASGDDAYKSVYRNNNGTQEYLKALTELIDNSTFSFKLPVDQLDGGAYYRVIITGKDEDGNDLQAKISSGYGFLVAVHGGAPLVSCSDDTYYDGKYYQTAAFSNADIPVKLRLKITDNSSDQAFRKLDNALTVTPLLYTGHHGSYAEAEAAVAAGTAKKKPLDEVKYNVTGSTDVITTDSSSGTSSTYTATLPVSVDFAKNLGAADNYTLILQVRANNGIPDNTYWCLYADGKAPVATVSNPWVPNARNLITEESSFWERKTVAELGGTTFSPAITANFYTMRGFWSDKDGSGTNGLFFRTVPKGDTLISDEILADSTKWVKVDSDDAPADATDSIGINNSMAVREGSGWQIAIYATDNVGNRTDVLTYSDIVFDFGVPEIELPAVESYYAKSDTPLALVITAKDSNKMASMSVTAKLNGKTVTSGSNGYTVTYSDVTPRAESMDSLAAYDATKYSTQTATIQIVRDGTAACDGTWTFSVTATDDVGRKSAEETFSTIVDATLPALTGSLSVEGTANTSSAWFKKDTLTLAATYTEETSGLDALYCLVVPGAAVDASLNDITEKSGVEQIAESGSTGKALAVSITPSSFEGGKNAVYIQTKDKAGNLSAVLAQNINVDLEIPSVSAEWYTYDGTTFVSAKSQVLSNGKKDVTLYGLVSDTESGIKDFSQGLTVGVTKMTGVSVLYTTAALSDSSESADFAAATYAAYSTVADKAAITAWKAVIPAAQINQGTVKLSMTDVAENSSTQSLFTFNYDDLPPEVKLVTPEDNSSLNGTVTFAGTAKDSALDSVTLAYSYSNAANATYTALGTVSGSAAYNWRFEDITLSYDEDGTVKLLGGADYAGSAKTVYFRLTARDSAGNETTKTYSYSADPDTDRPEIVLSNIKGDGTTLLKNTTIYGSVSDDDGTVKGLWYTPSATLAEETVPTTDNDNGWNKIALSNGNFTIEDETGDGNRTWYFYCIDGADGTFMTKAGKPLGRPYVRFVDGTAKTDNTAGVTFSIDTTPPDIQTFVLSRAASAVTTAPASYTPSDDGDDQWRDEDRVAFGGKTGKLYIKLVVDETTGMAADTPVAVSIDGKELALTTANFAKLSPSGSTYTYIVGPVDVGKDSIYENAVQTLSVTVTDKAGTAVSLAKNVIIDNEAPSVKITSPLDSTLVVNTVSMRGTVTDNAGGSGVSTVKYCIPTKEAAAKLTADSALWTDTGSTSSVSIAFDSTATGNPRNILTYANLTYATLTKTEEDGYYRVPVYFYVEDVLGNAAIVTDKGITVDTLASQPVATIITPADEKTVGASITVRGTAVDDLAVESVRLQIDANHDGKIDEADYTVLSTAANGWIEKNGWAVGTDLVPSSATGKNDWYILADGKNTWKLSLKVPDSFVMVNGEATTPQLIIRACAYDAVPQTRGWRSSVTVTVDKNTPTIDTLKLVKYSTSDLNTPVAELDYSDGIYISGKDSGFVWYLEGTVSDNGAVQKVTVANRNAGETITLSELNADNINTAEYSFKHPLTTSRDGSMYARLTVYDNNNTSTEQDISIWVDNTAPQLYNTAGKSSERANGSLRLKSSGTAIDNGSNTVQNSNGTYSFGDIVEEDGSGLSYIAFYFKRKGTTARVYNPMFPAGTTNANRTDIAGSVTINADDLVVLSLTGSRPGETMFTSATLRNNKNVRVGGLVKIGGIYRRITSVDARDTSGTIEFTPALATSYTTAEFVYAQIVDSTTDETIGNKDEDGDDMIEFIDVAGSSCTWTAKIDSSNIPDGPVELHVVAIDAAGNVSRGYCTTSVQNNRPRIAKILVGTDLNGNGTVDLSDNATFVNDISENATESGTDFGEFRYYSTIDGNGVSKYDITITADSIADTFTVKDGLLILPEFTGGNGGILSTYKFNSTALTTKGNGASAGETNNLKTGEAATKLVSTNAVSHISSFGAFYLDNDTLADQETKYTDQTTATNLAISFWDQTEETTQGTDSQWALLVLPLVIDVEDNEVPTSAITPFYWNAAKQTGTGATYNTLTDTSNSVYKNARGELLGHIELEADWEQSGSYNKNAVSGEYDGDAKVSGIIRVQGTAYDARRLGSISVKIGNTAAGIGLNGGNANTDTVLATYSKGSWVYTNKSATVETDGWQFAIQSDSNTQAGHTVRWELDIDTSYVKSGSTRKYAALDQLITVTAKDSNNLTATATYQVDIVPYITEVTTALSQNSTNSSVYARTAQGHYPVFAPNKWHAGASSDEVEAKTVTLGGYNLTGASATVGGATLAASGSSFLLTTASKTGELELTVSSVVSLNNKNYNDSHGSYSYAGTIGSAGDATAYANYYNRQPNGENNNILTDDVVLDVWDFNSQAAVGYAANTRVANAVMKVNPKNGLIGFAFSNGALRFSMPDTNTSYTFWNMSWDYMGYTGLGYNADGYSFAVAAGGDINNSGAADLFSFMSSRWGHVTSFSQSTNGSANNHLRLDSIGQVGDYSSPNSGEKYINKGRFQSSSIATSGNNVYLVYYDATNREIRFHAGAITGEKGTYGLFEDHGDDGAWKGRDYTTGATYAQIIAAAQHPNDTLGSAGKYVGVAGVPGSTAVALVWYDGTNLMYTYNENAVGETGKVGSVKTSGASWKGPYTLAEDAGEYCKVAVGSDGSVHVAAYDSENSDLIYVYIPQYNDDDIENNKQVAVVDSYLDVGANLTLDVAKVGSYQIPYIGYWGTFPELPRYAYLAKPETFFATEEAEQERNGAVDEQYTGVWECSIVPTVSEVNEGTMNVGVWKNADGERVYSTYSGDTTFSGQAPTSANVKYGSSTASTTSGTCYGNGTNNGVLGYVIAFNASTSYIETAQMR